jgi:hypothetical protein
MGMLAEYSIKELTIWYLRDQIGNEEPCRGIGEIIAYQIQIFLESHDSRVLSYMSAL